jgi:hypothetical protein
VSRPIDHGISWEDPKVLISSPGLETLNDKDSLTADPTENGLVYAVWDRLHVFPMDAQAAALDGGERRRGDRAEIAQFDGGRLVSVRTG